MTKKTKRVNKGKKAQEQQQEQQKEQRRRNAHTRHLNGQTPNKQVPRHILRTIAMEIAPHRDYLSPSKLATIVNQRIENYLKNKSPRMTRHLLQIMHEEAQKAQKSREIQNKKMELKRFSGIISSKNLLNHKGALAVQKGLANGTKKSCRKLFFN